MQTTKIVKGDKKKAVWVLHHNCSTNCNHCFCGKMNTSDVLSQTKDSCSDIQKLGFDCHVYSTDRTHEDLPQLKKIADSPTPNINVYAKDLSENYKTNQDPVHLSLSLMSSNLQINDKITSKGHYARTMKVIEYLQSKNQNFEVWTSIYSENYQEIPDFLEFILNKGARKIYINKLLMLGNGVNLPKNIFLTADQIKRFLLSIFEVFSEFREKGLHIELQPSWGPLVTNLEKILCQFGNKPTSRTYCPGGTTTFGLDPKSNDLWTCRFLISIAPLKIGYLDRDKGLVITENWPYEQEKIEEPCKSCNLLSSCGGGCRGTAIVEHLTSTGELNLHAGFTNCPYSLGIHIPSTLRNDIRSICSFVKHHGISPHS